jgi:hypothetical protein
MASYLVVEDGSGVPAANSYVDLATFRTYALQRGKTLPVDDNAAEVLLILAAQWIETRPRQFVGIRANPSPTNQTGSQGLSWPRTDEWCNANGVLISGGRSFINGQQLDGTLVPDNVVPQLIKTAQMMVAVTAIDTELFPIQSAPMVTVDKTDVLETHFSDKFGPLNDLVMPAVMAVLRPLYGSAPFVALYNSRA